MRPIEWHLPHGAVSSSQISILRPGAASSDAVAVYLTLIVGIGYRGKIARLLGYVDELASGSEDDIALVDEIVDQLGDGVFAADTNFLGDLAVRRIRKLGVKVENLALSFGKIVNVWILPVGRRHNQDHFVKPLSLAIGCSSSYHAAMRSSCHPAPAIPTSEKTTKGGITFAKYRCSSCGEPCKAVYTGSDISHDPDGEAKSHLASVEAMR